MSTWWNPVPIPSLCVPGASRQSWWTTTKKAQSVPGLDQADILEIVDHHRLADIETNNPIYVRNEPVGSSTTIVADMYQKRG